MRKLFLQQPKAFDWVIFNLFLDKRCNQEIEAHPSLSFFVTGVKNNMTDNEC